MTPLAHAGDVIETVVYLVPLLFLVAVLVRTKIMDRRGGKAPGKGEEAEPTLDEVMDDKP